MAKNRKHHTIKTIIARIGPRATYKVMVFVASWGIFMRKEGRPPETVDEFADWWKISQATAFRDQALFRKALPDADDPTHLLQWIAEEDPQLLDGDPGVVAFRLGAAL